MSAIRTTTQITIAPLLITGLIAGTFAASCSSEPEAPEVAEAEAGTWTVPEKEADEEQEAKEKEAIDPVVADVEADDDIAPSEEEDDTPVNEDEGELTFGLDLEQVESNRNEGAAKDAKLEIKQFFIAEAIEDRQPIRPAVHFTADVGELWGFVRVENHDAPTRITMVWKHRDVKKTSVELDVGVSAGWRTWSRRDMGPTDVGPWHIEVYDAQGRLLDALNFWVKPGKRG